MQVQLKKTYLAVLDASPGGASNHPAEPGSELDESLPARPQNGVRFSSATECRQSIAR
jgi:hypothetical protein